MPDAGFSFPLNIACSMKEAIKAFAFIMISWRSGVQLIPFWLITDALMMNDLKDLKRVHNLANYLRIKRIKDNVKAVEA